MSIWNNKPCFPSKQKCLNISNAIAMRYMHYEAHHMANKKGRILSLKRSHSVIHGSHSVVFQKGSHSVVFYRKRSRSVVFSAAVQHFGEHIHHTLEWFACWKSIFICKKSHIWLWTKPAFVPWNQRIQDFFIFLQIFHLDTENTKGGTWIRHWKWDVRAERLPT